MAVGVSVGVSTTGVPSCIRGLPLGDTFHATPIPELVLVKAALWHISCDGRGEGRTKLPAGALIAAARGDVS